MCQPLAVKIFRAGTPPPIPPPRPPPGATSSGVEWEVGVRSIDFHIKVLLYSLSKHSMNAMHI